MSSPTLPKVFVSEPVNQKGLDLLAGKAEVVLAPDTTKATALRLIADCAAVLARATTIFDAEVIAAAPNLRVIARTGVGYNNVDLAACAARNIPVCIAPGTNNETVAEQTLAMILALAKQVVHQDRAVRQGQWLERFSPRQMDVQGKTVALVGLGAIGRAVAVRCRAFGMHVLAFDPFFRGELTGVEFSDDLDELFRRADFLSLHCPATKETTDMVNARTLALMKPSAYLINTSRGDLVVEQDLADALHRGVVAGAAVDTFRAEPVRAGDPLLDCPNLILSPHLAGSTVESNERLATTAARAIVDVLEGRRPNHIVNEKLLTA